MGDFNRKEPGRNCPADTKEDYYEIGLENPFSFICPNVECSAVQPSLEIITEELENKFILEEILEIVYVET